jgi:hypothetical protein
MVNKYTLWFSLAALKILANPKFQTQVDGWGRPWRNHEFSRRLAEKDERKPVS